MSRPKRIEQASETRYRHIWSEGYRSGFVAAMEDERMRRVAVIAAHAEEEARRWRSQGFLRRVWSAVRGER